MVKQALPIYDDELKRDAQARLSRIEGQVRGIAKMLDDDRQCLEVLQQLASLQASLKGVTKTVLRNYLERCATDAIRGNDPAIYDQLIDVIFKFAK